MFFGVNCCVDWLVEANSSEMCAVCVFRAEVITSPQMNNCHFHENLKSHLGLKMEAVMFLGNNGYLSISPHSNTA